jgi:flagellar FliJ protein
MHSLKTLIKLFSTQLDERRRILTQHEKKREYLIFSLKGLRQELIDQQQITAADPEIAFSYGNYAFRNMENQNILNLATQDIDKQIIILQDEIFDIYSELKKYEITFANKEKQANYELQRREEAELNELAINNYNIKEQN